MEEVKKKRSNLVMPTHYQELTREEMEYVDGGAALTLAVAIKLSAKVIAASYATAFALGLYVRNVSGANKIHWLAHIGLSAFFSPAIYVGFVNGFYSK